MVGSRTVNGYILRLPGAAGEFTSYNATAMMIQNATSMAGPWTDEGSVENPSQANVVPRSYVTPRTLRYIRLYITGTGIDHYARIPEFEVWGVAPPPPAPVAAFTASPTSGTAPLAVQFTDQSTGSITSWSWTFGDGGTSAAGSPAHTYQSAGTYSVALTVTGPGGSNSATKPDYIAVAAPPVNIPGDMDGDNDVDLSDFALLQACLSGADVPQDAPACQKAKLDVDDDVDQEDFGIFQRCLSGPNVPGDPYCAD